MWIAGLRMEAAVQGVLRMWDVTGVWIEGFPRWFYAERARFCQRPRILMPNVHDFGGGRRFLCRTCTSDCRCIMTALASDLRFYWCRSPSSRCNPERGHARSGLHLKGPGKSCAFGITADTASEIVRVWDYGLGLRLVRPGKRVRSPSNRAQIAQMGSGDISMGVIIRAQIIRAQIVKAGRACDPNAPARLQVGGCWV